MSTALMRRSSVSPPRHTKALERVQDVLSVAARLAARSRRIDRYIDYFGGAPDWTGLRHGVATLEPEPVRQPRGQGRRHRTVA